MQAKSEIPSDAAGTQLKDMLNPVGTGRNDRTGQLVGPGTESVG